jgi:AraC-like DNA-binding protein
VLRVDTDLTFRQWRWAILMRAAVRQLATSDDHVRQIAFAIGYEHPSQFDRDFSRVFGMSPLQFRKLAQGAPRPQD